MQEIINKIFPMTQLRRKTSDVLEHTKDGPIVISENGVAHSLIISAREWDQIVVQLRRVESLEDEIEVLRGELQLERGEMELDEMPADWVAERVSA